jgi:hypothetical protein
VGPSAPTCHATKPVDADDREGDRSHQSEVLDHERPVGQVQGGATAEPDDTTGAFSEPRRHAQDLRDPLPVRSDDCKGLPQD